jgi:hypothetical protein
MRLDIQRQRFRFAGLALILCCGLAPSSAGALAWQAASSASALALQAAQTPPPNPQPSLADLAKKAREAHASQPKATKTFDNDSMKKAPPATPVRPVAAKPAAPKPPNTAALEKTYRAKFSQLRNSLKAAEAADQRLRAQMSYLGPNSAAVMHPYYDQPTIRNLQSQIDANNKKITTLKTQLDDLTDELRKKGLPSRWAEQ